MGDGCECGKLVHMTSTWVLLIFLIIGIAVGGVAGFQYGRSKAAAGTTPGDVAQLTAATVRAEAAEAYAQQLGQVQGTLSPITDAVGALQEHVHALQAERAEVMGHLIAQIQHVTAASYQLGEKTDRLTGALRNPQIRGRWGEMQLERVVELSGMQRHCDFDTQVQVTAQGETVRPDMVIRLSGGRSIIVDSKVPFAAYLDALSAENDEEAAAYLHRHHHLLKQHIKELSSKNYRSAFHPTPEFVVLFVPNDGFLDTALAQDSELLDYAFSRNIILATPSTLMALLRTVALGWRNAELSERADEISRLGSQLYSRLNTMAEHYNRVGNSLEKAVDAYNATLASIDSRVMVTARKLHEAALSDTTAEPSKLSPAQGHPRRVADPAAYAPPASEAPQLPETDTPLLPGAWEDLR